ncbi:MAG TPA: prolyl oligopeptidase family serine peptidase [Steroidobacteraceae bacterium]|nr:prolyl oligopeptidase family serine peptidase [Steroidobacteraceae bacterium]
MKATLTCLIAAALLSGCNLGTSPGSSSAPGSSSPQRGQLITNPPTMTGSYGPGELRTLLMGNSTAAQFLQLSSSLTCTVTVYHFEYYTVGAKGESTQASGALMIPSGTGTGCSGGRPIVEYAHGTTPDKTFNIADLSRADNDEGLLLAAVFASQGYIVVAPNYAGYDTSTLAYHPYLLADPQSKDMIDALAAARTALSGKLAPPSTDSGKLFITGYSQGGFVAMATARAMQGANEAVTAAAPMSGPYALAAFGDAIFNGEVNLSATLNTAMLVGSYQQAYGNLYSQPTDVFTSQYASGIATLLPSTTPITTIYSQGLLPQNALFSATPPAPQYQSITPPKTPANLAPAFALGFGDPPLVLNSYRESYLTDAAATPDGGFPTVTTNQPAANPTNTLRQAFKMNDLRDWVPTVPILMCGGASDPDVFFFNTQLMQQYWTTHPPTTPVTVLNVDTTPTGTYAAYQTAFGVLKTAVAAAAVAGGATDGGALAVLEDYHAGLVPPVCLAAVKVFFDGEL